MLSLPREAENTWAAQHLVRNVSIVLETFRAPGVIPKFSEKGTTIDMEAFAEVRCWKADARVFTKRGFRIERQDPEEVTCTLRHATPDMDNMKALLGAGASGIRFVARAIPNADHQGSVMASDGKRFALVSAIGTCAEPAVRVDEYGNPRGLDTARYYWKVRAAVLQSMREEEISHYR